MLHDIRRVLALLPSTERARWAMLVPLSGLAAAMEAIAALLVVAWIGLVTNPEEAPKLPFGLTTPFVAADDVAGRLIVWSVAVTSFFAIKSGVVLLFTFLGARVAASSTVSVSTSLMRKYLSADYEFFFDRTSSGLKNNLLSACDKVFTGVARAGLEAASELMLLAAVLFALVYAAPSTALIAAGLLTVLLAALLRLTRKIFVHLGHVSHVLRRKLLEIIQHSVGAIKEVKVLQKEEFFAEHFAKARAQLSGALAKRTALDAAPRVTLDAVFVAIIAFLVVMLHVVSSGEDTMSTLALFAFAGFRILPSVARIMAHVNAFRFGQSALRELEEDFQQMGHFVDAQSTRPDTTSAVPSGADMTLEDVSYTYPGCDEPALEGISTRIKTGESIGIVGTTGAGKSTLVDILLGLLRPSTGRAMVGDHDLIDVRDRWYPRVGYVPQDIFLLDDTIAANVAFGLPAAEIDEARVRESLRMAQALDFVEQLPKGIHTGTGERGIRLSGGQRQRLAIARALYRDPEVLIFDEATSALDHATEVELAATVRELGGGRRTTIIVAHRMTTVRHCTRLLVLDHGTLAAEGDYETLLAVSPQFRVIAGGATAA